MRAVKSKWALVLGLVELLTLGTAVLLYLGARRFEQAARRTGEPNRNLRELLASSFSGHAYTDASGRPLSQRTPDTDGQQLAAAASFESRIQRIATEQPASSEADALAPASHLRITRALVACVSPYLNLPWPTF
jgi:hypothetical protein